MKTILAVVISVLVLASLDVQGSDRVIPFSQRIKMSVVRTYGLERRTRDVAGLCVTVTNATEQTVVLQNPWPRVNFRVTAARDSKWLPSLQPRFDAVSGDSGSFELKSGQSRSFTFDPAKWFEVSSPGSYAVYVEFDLEYRNMPAIINRVLPDERVSAQVTFNI